MPGPRVRNSSRVGSRTAVRRGCGTSGPILEELRTGDVRPTTTEPPRYGRGVTAPIDPTGTSAWAELDAHRASFDPDLRGWFAADDDRVGKLSFPLADLHVDLSKNLVTDEILASLVKLAEQTGVAERYAAMRAGEHINTTEDRAVLHTALRRPAGAEPALVVDGQNVDDDVQEVLSRMADFANRVRSGEWKGVTGKKVTHIVNISIGGSSTAWKPASSSRKTSGPNSIMSDRPMAESTE